MGSVLALIDVSWVTVAALCSVLSDGFLPFVPSGSVVAAACMETYENHGSYTALIVQVAIASFLGDLLLLWCARRCSNWAQRRLAARPAWRDIAEYVRESSRGKPARTVITARFMPGGRTVLDLAVGTSPAPLRRFIGWSAVSASVWAVYMVGISYLDERWINIGWLSLAVSCVAAFGLSGFVARAVRRGSRRRRELAEASAGPDGESAGAAAGAAGTLEGGKAPSRLSPAYTVETAVDSAA